MYLPIISMHICDGALASWNLLLNFSHCSFIFSCRPSPHPPSLCLIFLRANPTWTRRCPSDRPPPSLSSLWQRLPTTRTTKWRQIPRKLLTSPDRSANRQLNISPFKPATNDLILLSCLGLDEPDCCLYMLIVFVYLGGSSMFSPSEFFFLL